MGTEEQSTNGGGTATVCDFSDATKTISALAAAYPSGGPLGMGALTAGSSRYYEVGVALPSNADNSYQGRSASFDLTWTLVQ